MCRLLDTGDYESIYRSIARLLGIVDADIHSYARERALTHDLDSLCMYCDERGHFYEWASDNVEDEENLKIDYVTIYHFAKRLESSDELEGMGLQNLHEILLGKNKLIDFLDEYGINFIERNGHIVCLYNGVELDFSHTRERFNEDTCINGYLFGGNIYDEGEIRHLKNGPEFIQDIENVINKQIFNGDSSLNLRSEYRRRSKGFIFKIKVPINELTFDGCGYENEYNVEYNTEEIYKCVGSYLVNQVLHRGISNRVIRLRDNAKVDADNILEIIEVSDEDLYRY